MTPTKAEIDYIENVIEDRVKGLSADVAITAMMRLVVKLTQNMDVHEKVRATLIVSHYGGKVATSVIDSRGG